MLASGLASVFLAFRQDLKKPDIYLDRSHFRISVPKKTDIIGNYKDYELFIDEAPKKSPESKNYRYRLSFRNLATSDSFVIYPSFYTASRLHDVIDALNSQIETPMNLIFDTNRLALDYQKAEFLG